MTEPTQPATPAEVAYAEFRRSGSPRAMAAVFDATAPELLLLARRWVRDAAAAEDLVQQTFLRAIERAAQFDPSRRLLPWLTTILANEARMERRRQRVPDPARLRVGASREPSREAERREAQQAMDAALAQLPADYRDVVALRLLHGVRPAAIAAALAVPVPTVKTRLHRGVRKLAAALPPGLALGAVVTLASGRGLAAARREVAGGTAAATFGWSLSGLLTMKKTVAGVAVAMLLLAVLPFVFGGEPPVPTTETTSVAVAPGARATVAVGADAPPVPIARVAAGVGEGMAPEPSDARPVNLDLLVRATWQPSGEAAVDVPLTLLVQPDHRLANARTDGRGEARFAQRIAARVWPEGLRADGRGVSIVSPLAPGRFHNLQLGDAAGVLEVELEEGLRVAGVVVDDRDQRIAGAKVWLALSPYPDIHATSTDAAGRFALRGLRADFAIHASAGTAVSAPLTRTDIGEHGEIVLRLTQPGDRVAVRVEDRSGQPVADATVRLATGWRVSPPPRQAQLVTGDDGVAVFDGLPGDAWIVEVVHAEQPPAQHRFENPGTGIRLTETIVLGRSATMIGLVRRSDGAAVAGATITLNDAVSLLQATWHTKSDGRFEADRLAVGSYDVWIRSGAADLRQRLQLREGEQRVEFTLPGAACIAGRLLDAGGQPAVGWTLQAQRIDEMGGGATARTDADGRFAIAELPEAAFRLDARGPDGRGGYTFFDVATDGRELVYTLPPAAMWQPATIVGRLQDAPPGAFVQLASANDYGGSGSSLAADGAFTLDGLAPGRYHVGFEIGTLSWWLAEVEIRSGEILDLGVVTRPRTGRLEVRVGAAATVVQLRSKVRGGPSRIAPLAQVAAGVWLAEPVAAGAYHVIVEGPDVGPTLTEVEIAADATTAITVTPAPAIEVAFRFEPPTGTPWQQIGPRTTTVRSEPSGAIVRFQEIMGPLRQRQQFTAGTYTIEVETGGGFRGGTTFTVPAIDDGPIIVSLAR